MIIRKCVVDVAALRAHARNGAELTSQVRRGEPVQLLDEGNCHRRVWAYVLAAHYSTPGYIRIENLGEVVSERAFTRWPGVPHPGDPVAAARHFLGVRYFMSGRTEAGIDCSGLIGRAYLDACRIRLERDCWQIEKAAREGRGSHLIGWHELQPGDLITYGRDLAHPYEGRACHISMWLGYGRIIHATKRHDLLFPKVDGVVEEAETIRANALRRYAIRIDRPEKGGV